MTIAQTYHQLSGRFKAAGIDSASLDAEVLIAHILEKDRSFIVAHGEEELSEPQIHSIERVAHLRETRMPLAYITGCKEFYGLSFRVNRSVLIPRPDTEILVEAARGFLESHPRCTTIVDVGTGSGCIGLSLAATITSIQVTLIEKSVRALACARANATALKLSKRIHLLRRDLLSNTPGPLHCIVANLPYLSEKDYCEARNAYPEIGYEPKNALVALDNGLLVIKKLITESALFLPDLCALFLEMNPLQISEMKKYAKEIYPDAIFKEYLDLAGNVRVLGILRS